MVLLILRQGNPFPGGIMLMKNETSLLPKESGVLLSEGKVFLYRDSTQTEEYLN